MLVLSGDGGPGGPTTLQAGDRVSIESWTRADGSQVLPFFSSPDAAQRGLAVLSESGAPSPTMILPARALFELTAGATLVLNPGSDYGKEFLPPEIASLLGTGVGRSVTPRVAEEDVEVLVGTPAPLPAEMIGALRRFFATRPAVRSARLAMMRDPRTDGPSLVVGVEVKGVAERTMRQASAVAADTAPDGVPVDLMHVDPSGGLLRGVEPFYTRGLGSMLKAALGLRG